jgi:hypothetical protein
MELKDFVTQTLSDIVLGVDNANNLKEGENKINFNTKGKVVDFDISVIVNKSNKKEKKAGVNKLLVVDSYSEASKGMVNRIKFSVNTEKPSQVESGQVV